MFILPIDELENYQTFAYGERIFSDDECDRMVAMMRDDTAQQATVGAESRYDPLIREALKARFSWNTDVDWIFQKLMASALQCNREFYRFQLTGFMEPLEILRYGSGGFFDWHQDFNGKAMSIRKLSIVVQLADPASYDGGVLEFLDGSKPLQAPRSRGAVIIFPSFVMHRVTPVTRGLRHSLVAWVSGPPYR